MAIYVYICPNCGAHTIFAENEDKNKKCSCGENSFISLSIQQCHYYKLSEIEQQKIDQKALNLNDQQYTEQKEVWKKVREPIEKRYEEERQARFQRNHEIEMRNRIRCPYCKSTDVSKISTLGRAASVGVFGLASKKIGKQWHCNHCKSDF